MNNAVNDILSWLLAVLRHEEIVVFLASMLPLIEARGAIPIAIGYGLSPLDAWFYAFIGSSITAPVLLLAFLPLLELIKRIPLLKKTSAFFIEKFNKKANDFHKKNVRQNAQKTRQSDKQKNVSGQNSDEYGLGAYIAIFLFVAVPLPLTGVWSGSIIAAILSLKFHKALPALVLGNMLSCIMLTVLCTAFSEYISQITLAIAILAIASVGVMIIKIIIHKPSQKAIN